jgi:hypothetical protein
MVSFDISNWILRLGKAEQYYKEFFKFFICHNILAEVYLSDGNEAAFTNKVILPILESTKEKSNLKPLIWNYLDGSESKDKYYWDTYPKAVADFLTSKGYN